MIGWLKRLFRLFLRSKQESAVPDQTPEPQNQSSPQKQPALSPLMQRVKAARDANDIDLLRRFRWCFHEAAHAVVAHYFGSKVTRIEVNVAAGKRPKAVIDNKILKPLAAAVTRHGPGSQQACEAAVPFFAQYSAGELMDNEVQPHFELLSTKLNAETWSKFIPEEREADLDMIVKMARGAGLKNRTDLVEDGQERAREIITERRRSFEALVTRLLENGNLEGAPLQAILDIK